MLRLALLPLFSLSSFAAAQLTQPREGQVYNSFSGSGSFPVQYNDARGSLDLSVRDGSGFDYILANGIQAASGNTLSTAFAPLGICGDATLTAREQGRNASASTANFTITCSPIQLATPERSRKRQSGPSGTLTRPSGGQVFQQGDSLSVAYTPVTEGGETFAIDGLLVGETQNFTLFNGLWKANSSSTITGLFSIPEAACGALQFIVTEHQIYQSSAIAFQAAAPAINVVCAANATNTTSPANSTAVPTNITSTATVVPTATSSAANSTTTLFNSTTSASPSTTTGSSSIVTSNGTTLPVGSTIPESSSSLQSSSTTSLPTTSSSTLTSTIVTTSDASTGPATVTSIITTTLPASTISSTTSTSPSSSGSTSSTTSSSSTSIPQGVSTVTVTNSTQPTSTSSRSIISSGPALVSTVTVTAQPSSEAGPTTIRVSQSSQSSGASVTSLTNTFTVTQLVVVAAPSQSRITSTRLQTVIYISPSVVAVVQPSSAPTTALQPTGGASVNAVSTSLALCAAAALLSALVLC